MTVKEIITELQKLGINVKARKRVDGGYIITQINNMTFTGAKGNAEARKILGVNLSQARISQTSFNVEKYIKVGKGGVKSKSKKLDPEMKELLRSVQRKWRKLGVKGKVSAKKVKWHIQEEGREAAIKYLEKMNRYANGYAYEENVDSLIQYAEDVALGCTNEDLKEKIYEVRDLIASKREVFREAWIEPTYRDFYTIIEHKYSQIITLSMLQHIRGRIGR